METDHVVHPKPRQSPPIDSVEFPRQLVPGEIDTFLAYVRENRPVHSYVAEASIDTVVSSNPHAKVGRLHVRLPDGPSYDFLLSKGTERMTLEQGHGYMLDLAIIDEVRRMVDGYFSQKPN